jgi:hypothetical protein
VSLTPLEVALKALILALKDSAEALVLRLLKKFRKCSARDSRLRLFSRKENTYFNTPQIFGLSRSNPCADRTTKKPGIVHTRLHIDSFMVLRAGNYLNTFMAS